MNQSKKIIFMSILLLAPWAHLNSKGHSRSKKHVDLKSTEIKNKLSRFAQIAYSTYATIEKTFEIATACIENNIEGDFCECGVAAGAQIAAMAYASQLLGDTKKVHVFDSFEGIPLAGPNDAEQPGIGKITHSVNVENLNSLLVSSGVSSCSLNNVAANMAQFGLEPHRFVYYKGWFQDSLPVVNHKIDKISFLRLDGDLYESTKVCLEYLYPKMSKGGFVVIDDYGLSGCKKAVHEYLDKHNLTPTIIEIPGGQGPVYWQVQ